MVKPFREIIDGELIVNLHSGQNKVDDSEARFVVMLAGTQGGKTCYGVHWLFREIQRCGEGDYLAITATFPLLRLKMLPEFLYVFETLLQLGTYNKADKVFTFKNNKTRVIFGSATNSESIESATAKAAWMDEAGQSQFKREAWEAIQRRLSIHKGKVLFTTTLYGLGWLKTELYDRWKEGDTDIEVIQFKSTVNPSFPQDEYERAKKVLPNWKFSLFYKGEYETPAGLIYDSFNQDVCIIDRFPIPKEWQIYTGHDFGGANPAAMFYAKDFDTGYFYAFKSYKPNEAKTVAEQVSEFKEIICLPGEYGKKQPEIYNVIKRAGGSHQEIGWRDDYTAHGWPIQEPKYSNDVEVGIEKVYALNKLNKVFVFRDMFDYLDEKLSYSRELDDDYNPTDKIADKAKYHLMDCERSILSDFTPETVDMSRRQSKHSMRI